MDQKEEVIWGKIQQKDSKAFESYYKLHYKAFYQMACKYLKDSAQAEEIVNDVFIKLWEDAPALRIEISLKSYLYKAIINRSINLLQKLKREELQRSSMKYESEEGYELREMEENELKIRLYKAIDDLPAQCRKVFQLSRFEKLKQQEIADKLGISVKTVKNHITHALKEISKSMGELMIIAIWFLKNILHF